MDLRLDVGALMREIGAKARRRLAASSLMRRLSRRTWRFGEAADAILDGRAALLAANAADMAEAEAKGLGGAMLDRLKLDEARVEAMVEGLRAIAGQADPVGQVMAEWDRPSGLHIRRVQHAHRGDRGHLREPAERDRRRRGALSEGRATRRSCAAARRACALRRRSTRRSSRGWRRRGCRRRRSSSCPRPTAPRSARCWP